jgi:hypothetical protein
MFFFFLRSMLEEILDYRNISKALKQVMSNKGAGGVDGMQTDELRDYLNEHWRPLKNKYFRRQLPTKPGTESRNPQAHRGSQDVRHTHRNRQTPSTSHQSMAKSAIRAGVFQNKLWFQARQERPSGGHAGTGVPQ